MASKAWSKMSIDHAARGARSKERPDQRDETSGRRPRGELAQDQCDGHTIVGILEIQEDLVVVAELGRVVRDEDLRDAGKVTSEAGLAAVEGSQSSQSIVTGDCIPDDRFKEPSEHDRQGDGAHVGDSGRTEAGVLWKGEDEGLVPSGRRLSRSDAEAEEKSEMRQKDARVCKTPDNLAIDAVASRGLVARVALDGSSQRSLVEEIQEKRRGSIQGEIHVREHHVRSRVEIGVVGHCIIRCGERRSRSGREEVLMASGTAGALEDLHMRQSIPRFQGRLHAAQQGVLLRLDAQRIVRSQDFFARLRDHGEQPGIQDVHGGLGKIARRHLMRERGAVPEGVVGRGELALGRHKVQESSVVPRHWMRGSWQRGWRREAAERQVHQRMVCGDAPVVVDVQARMQGRHGRIRCKGMVHAGKARRGPEMDEAGLGLELLQLEELLRRTRRSVVPVGPKASVDVTEDHGGRSQREKRARHLHGTHGGRVVDSRDAVADALDQERYGKRVLSGTGTREKRPGIRRGQSNETTTLAHTNAAMQQGRSHDQSRMRETSSVSVLDEPRL